MRLSADGIKGIWLGCVMPWDSAFRFDTEAYAKSVHRAIQHQPHGIYTTGSTGEFYAIEFDEFEDMVQIQASLCGEHNVPLQIGCCADATHKTIRLFEYAASKPQVGAAQIVLPYWMEMSDREVLQFFQDLYRACPELPIVHYNIPRCKRFLGAAMYMKILEVCPSLVGVKYTFAGSNFGSLQNDLLALPQLSFFVAENLLVSAMQLGAQGSYSSIIATNPSFIQSLYSHAERGNWNEAMAMQKKLARFYSKLGGLIGKLGEGDSDPVIDKAIAVASGFFGGHQRCRAPYIGWSDESVRELREFMRRECPELIYQG